MKKRALQYALTFKQNNGAIKVVDDFKLKKPSTKEMAKILSDLKTEGKTLLVLDKNDKVIQKSSSNLKGVNTTLVQNLNAFEVLNSSNIVFLKDSIINLQEKYK